MNRFSWLWLLGVALVPAFTQAQEFELDLSEEKPAKPDPEFRPSIALLSVRPADAEEASIGRARQLEAELLKLLAQGEDFQTVVEPSVVDRLLGAEAAKAKACEDWSCFETAAKALKVHRAFRVTVAKAGVGSLVTFVGYDPGLGEVMTESHDSGEKAERTFMGVAGKSQAQKDREFIKKINGFLKSTLTKLATANAKIVVDSPEASTPVTIDGEAAGVGSFSTIVQRGRHTVKVEADGFLPFEESVTLEPQQTTTVKVSLIAKPVEAPVVVKKEVPQGSPIFQKPGLYVAVAGAVAVGTGIAFGQIATGIQARVNAGGKPVAATRAEAKSAQTYALLANVLVGVGAAMVAGGTLWVVLTPAPPPPSLEPSRTDAPVGAMLGVGGTF